MAQRAPRHSQGSATSQSTSACLLVAIPVAALILIYTYRKLPGGQVIELAQPGYQAWPLPGHAAWTAPLLAAAVLRRPET
jgi:hypothetical protein